MDLPSRQLGDGSVVDTKDVNLGLSSILMVLWFELCPPQEKRYVAVLTPLECNCFGTMVIADAKSQVKRRSGWCGVGPTPESTGVLTRTEETRRYRHTMRRMPGEDGERDWSDTAANERKPRIISKLPKTRTRQGRTSSYGLKGNIVLLTP